MVHDTVTSMRKSLVWVRHLIKPKQGWAPWLLLAMMSLLFFLMANGYVELLKTHLDAEGYAINLAGHRLSLYTLIRGLVSLVVIAWVATTMSELGDSLIMRLHHIRASNRILLAKFVQIFCYVVAAVFTLDYIGIDWKTVTLLGSAIGIGLGLGLQKIASNYISGFILLMEKGIEADDLVELSDGTTGFLRRTAARYTLVETFDGKEIMIPNEDFISNRVTNWTYSTKRARISIPVGVTYDSDLELAQKLMLEAANNHPRTLKDPAPFCPMRAFGDSSVNFSLFFWIQDVTEGTFMVQNDVMFAIMKAFAANNISFAYPRREVHMVMDTPRASTTPTPALALPEQTG